jgi:hypothetical protein
VGRFGLGPAPGALLKFPHAGIFSGFKRVYWKCLYFIVILSFHFTGKKTGLTWL